MVFLLLEIGDGRNQRQLALTFTSKPFPLYLILFLYLHQNKLSLFQLSPASMSLVHVLSMEIYQNYPPF